MDALRTYLLPLLISNLLGILTFIAAIKKPMWSRCFLAAVFLWAACVNAGFAMHNPGIYLEYGNLTPVPLYKDFIFGFFSQHIGPIVVDIALAQFAIFLGLVLNRVWTKLACLGGMVFGVAIAPLLIGSGFPASLFMAAAFYILLSRYNHDFIWKWSQYHKRLANDLNHTLG